MTADLTFRFFCSKPISKPRTQNQTQDQSQDQSQEHRPKITPTRGPPNMPIKVGDHLPTAKFRVMTAEGPAWKTTDEVFKGKKVVLFAVPGAFTPTCHKNHLPSIVQNADGLKGKGIDTIAVTSVNDVFVMDAWKK